MQHLFTYLLSWCLCTCDMSVSVHTCACERKALKNWFLCSTVCSWNRTHSISLAYRCDSTCRVLLLFYRELSRCFRIQKDTTTTSKYQCQQVTKSSVRKISVSNASEFASCQHWKITYIFRNDCFHVQNFLSDHRSRNTDLDLQILS